MKLVEQFEISCQTLIFSIPLIIPPHYTPYCFPLRELQLPRQRLLRTFRSQQRYLEVSARSKDEFEASFEVIQIIFGSIFDIKLRQRQNHTIDHEIS